ncbi:hypothetical protein [Nannocystis pusilla]|uniref:Uncharacterized protein n=1 Tax=Nannocystis pusilla TaxID=889268 RepID=A0ABS7TWY4_9BACT|nr:hypothetical protein [Nannocystis pusilla]MBZ5712713.1 hypothetical protein [Nannocystis pusilla]
MTSRSLTVVLSLGCGCNSLYLQDDGGAGTSTGAGIDLSTGADATTTGITEVTTGDSTMWMVASISSTGETSTSETSTSTSDSSSGGTSETTGDNKAGRLMFLTSGKFNGKMEGQNENLGNEGLAINRANWRCQSLAMDACLEGTFQAWLSTEVSHAASRVGANAELNSLQFELVGGGVVAADWDGLTSGWFSEPEKKLLSAILKDETGADVSEDDSTFWSWTKPDGSWHKPSCPEPESNKKMAGGIGKGALKDSKWSAFQPADCHTFHRLLCIQTSFQNPPAP